jgi:hypothetical protein
VLDLAVFFIFGSDLSARTGLLAIPCLPLSQSAGEREQIPSQFVLTANVWPRRPAGLFSTARLRPRPGFAPRAGNSYRPGRSDRATSVSFSQQFSRALHFSSDRSTAAGTETVTLLWRKLRTIVHCPNRTVTARRDQWPLPAVDIKITWSPSFRAPGAGIGCGD